MRPVKQMQTGLGLTAVGVIAALALLGTSAQATRGARIASTCSNETVNGGKYVEDINLRGKVTLRFVLIGSVTCDEAHRLVRAYFGKMAADQQCGTLNSFCDLQFAGGWDCFIGPPAQQQAGAIAACIRTGAKIRVYKASLTTSGTRHLRVFASPNRTVFCELSSAGAFCDVGNFSGNGFHSGTVKPSGKVSICNRSPGGAYCGALGGPAIPALHFGQRDELYGFRCTPATRGLTCTVVAGAGRGKGFFINATSARRIGL